ncbi:hypothetical protein, partial [Enterobacter asburiae]
GTKVTLPLVRCPPTATPESQARHAHPPGTAPPPPPPPPAPPPPPPPPRPPPDVFRAPPASQIGLVVSWAGTGV